MKGWGMQDIKLNFLKMLLRLPEGVRPRYLNDYIGRELSGILANRQQELIRLRWRKVELERQLTELKR